MKEFKLSELAQKTNAQIKGNPEVIIRGVATLQSAKQGELSFLANSSYKKYLSETKASAVIVTEKDAEECSGDVNALIVKNPHYAYSVIASLFALKISYAAGIHPSAVIGKNCSIDKTVYIGPHVVIGEHVSIGKNTVIEANSVIQNNTHIGENCFLWPQVTLYQQTQIGNRVVIHSGSVIGADGFGFALEKGSWHKVPQLGKVILEDDVDIGANVSIDRGAIDDTVIETGVKLDNQIQIGHNVRIGAHTVIAGSTGIAGSTTIGKYCMIGGHVGISGHITICDQVIITGKSSVGQSIDKPGMYSSGFPAKPSRSWWRIVNQVLNIGNMVKRINDLEKESENE